MTKKQLLNKAKFLVFPINIPSNGFSNSIDLEVFREIIKRYPNNETVVLPCGETYNEWERNNHHYTTNYHKEFVLPQISNMFDNEIKPNDFIWKKIVNNVPSCYVLEAPVFNEDEYKFTNHSINYESTRNVLLANENDLVENYCLTEYHKLFVGGHSVCTVEKTKGKTNGKTMFIVCNSQMIPSIPVLAHYYKKLVVVDNRASEDVSKLYENENFDDVLICVWRFNGIEPDNYIDKYVLNF